MNATLEFPPIDETMAEQTRSAVVAAPEPAQDLATMDLATMDLKTIALSGFYPHSRQAEEAKAALTGLVLDLSNQARIDEAKSLRWRLIGQPMADVRKLKDAEGNYIWRPGLEAGQPDTLLGYGIAENEDMPAKAANALSIAFGDFRRGYTVVDRIGTRILRDPYTNKPFVGFYVTKRVGGFLADSTSIKLFKFAAA